MNCPDCDRYMHHPTCPCGFVDPGPRKKKLEEREKVNEEITETRKNELLGPWLTRGREKVEEIKKKFPDTWRSELLKHISKEAKKIGKPGAGSTSERGDKRRANAKLVNDTHGFLPYKDQVLSTMPAPNDVEGMKKYIEELRKVQFVFPPDHQKLGDRQ